MKKKISGREIAYLVLRRVYKGEGFLNEHLERYGQIEEKEFRLAREIAFGVMRRTLTLDYLAKKLTTKKKLTLKGKEKILLRIALYQYYFMDRIPLYAIASESVFLSKKYCGKIFSSFLNALLRKLENTPLTSFSHKLSGKARQSVILRSDGMTDVGNCPEVSEKSRLNLPDELDVAYSFPKLFIDILRGQFSEKEIRDLLELLNQPGTSMVRLRPNATVSLDDCEKLEDAVYRVDANLIKKLKDNPDVYFQNATQIYLMRRLSSYVSSPNNILDACAAPGGKLLLLRDLYPKAELTANDVSISRMKRLEENIKKYALHVKLTRENAENYQTKTAFDLIVIDAPCSNSGVFHKRPEARWRLTKTSLKQLTSMQYAMIASAASHLKENGKIWYLTCSILGEENEEMMEKAHKKLGLNIEGEMISVLPNKAGWDGGFGCCLSKEV